MSRYLVIIAILVAFSSQGQIITTVAGNGTVGVTMNNVPAISTHVQPVCSAFDSHGNYYFSQQNANTVCMIDSLGIVHVIAGGGSSGLGDGGLATSAQLNYPDGIAFDTIGNLYIADHGHYRIRKVDISTGVISTYAGNGINGNSGDNNLATLAEILPMDIRFDTKGNLYISEGDPNNTIRKVNPSTGIISTFAGTGVAGFSGDNNQATLAQLYQPVGLAIDKNNNLYVADCGNRRIRRIDTNNVITTVGGNGSTGTIVENIPALNAHISPYGLWVDSKNNIFFGDTLHKIRMIDSSGIIHTVAGNGTVGYNGDNIQAITAELYAPGFPIIDNCGNLYFGDEFNYRIRKVWFNTDTLPHAAMAISPNDTVTTGTPVTTTATVNTGTITTCQWIKNGVTTGTTASTYTYTPTNGDSLYCIVTARACTGRTYTDTTQVLHITVTGGVGIANTTQATTYTYPNPVRDVLYITNVEAQSYTLYTVIGKAVLQGTVSKNGSIDMRAIPTGVYLLELTKQDGAKEVVRVVKE